MAVVWLAVARSRARPRREGGHHLDEAGLLVVDLVAVDVDHPVVALGQREGDLERGDAVLARVLEVGDGAHRVGPPAHRLLEQLGAAVVRADALLGEGDDLEADDLADALAHLEQRVERDEARIADVDVRAHVQDAVGRVPAEHLGRAVDDVLPGQ
jgi:hypothetical protein